MSDETERKTAGLGPRIRTARQSMAWSLPQLADRASISKGYLWQLENERNANPSMEVLLRIAGALDMTIAPLLGQPGVTATWETPLPEDLHPSLKEFLSERRRGGRAVPAEDVRVLHSIQRQSESWGDGQAFRIEAMSLGSAAGTPPRVLALLRPVG